MTLGKTVLTRTELRQSKQMTHKNRNVCLNKPGPKERKIQFSKNLMKAQPWVKCQWMLRCVIQIGSHQLGTIRRQVPENQRYLMLNMNGKYSVVRDVSQPANGGNPQGCKHMKYSETLFSVGNWAFSVFSCSVQQTSSAGSHSSSSFSCL